VQRPARAPCGLLACLGAAQLLAGAALAQTASEPWRGVYLGGGGGYSTVSVEVYSSDDCDYECWWWGDYEAYDQGDGDYGWSAHFGWRAHTYFAIEAGYVSTGSIGWDQDLVYMPEFDDFYNNRVRFSAEVVEVSALGILPFLEVWELYLRLGAGFWDGRSEQLLDQSFGPAVVTRSVEDSGTGILYGVGVGVTLAQSWHLRLDVQSLTIDREVLNASDDTSLDSLLFEVQYRFGARRPVARPAAPATAKP
jgi:hypothetical protein